MNIILNNVYEKYFYSSINLLCFSYYCIIPRFAILILCALTLGGCATFGFLTFCLYKKYENNATLWYLGAGCLLYNPILPIHLTREIWLIINGLSIVLLFLTILHGKKNKN